MSLGKVGKFLYTVPFLAFGIMHFVMGEAFVNFVPEYLPFAKFWLYGTGLCFLAGVISVNTGKHAALAMKLLAVLLAVIIVTIHIPAGQAMQTPMIFSIGLLGASLALSETVE
jgi:uncharacterized membrane protein|tara:strand:+ start:573 stop:911 length:339 start_codon:yes stop_codon:yes gene_type:complete